MCPLRGRVRQHLHPSATVWWVRVLWCSTENVLVSGFSGVPQVCTLCSHVLIPAPAQLEHILTSSEDISPKADIGTLEAMSPLPDLLCPWPEEPPGPVRSPAVLWSSGASRALLFLPHALPSTLLSKHLMTSSRSSLLDLNLPSRSRPSPQLSQQARLSAAPPAPGECTGCSIPS